MLRRVAAAEGTEDPGGAAVPPSRDWFWRLLLVLMTHRREPHIRALSPFLKKEKGTQDLQGGEV